MIEYFTLKQRQKLTEQGDCAATACLVTGLDFFSIVLYTESI